MNMDENDAKDKSKKIMGTKKKAMSNEKWGE